VRAVSSLEVSYLWKSYHLWKWLGGGGGRATLYRVPVRGGASARAIPRAGRRRSASACRIRLSPPGRSASLLDASRVYIAVQRCRFSNHQASFGIIGATPPGRHVVANVARFALLTPINRDRIFKARCEFGAVV